MKPAVAGPFDADIAAIAAMPTVNRIFEVISKMTGMRFVAVARVTPEKWVCLASKDELGFGLGPGGELPLQTTICNEIRQSGSAVFIDHVASDEVFREHATPATYGFQSYASVPLYLSDGSFYGTLCAIDPSPTPLAASGAAELFRLLADLLQSQLQTAERAIRAEASLLDAHATAELREQFIAVLGHDLRNPLQSLQTGAQVLGRMITEEKASAMLVRMQRSVQRMSSLIDDVTDLTRTRLGGGIVLDRAHESLEPALRHVVDELRAAHPHRVVALELELGRPVLADRHRIGQLLSNLLANALVHGAAGTPVRVRATTREAFELSVSNDGPDIAPEIVPRLFAPFVRGAASPARQGLGLGLHIAAEIARAHGGAIRVESAGGTTRFTFSMPI